MKLDDEREIEETRAFFMEHGLLPPIPERYANDEEEAEQVLLRILSRRTPSAPSAVWRRRALLAAVVVVIIAIGAGAQAFFRGVPAVAAGTPPMLTYSATRPQSVASAAPAARVLTVAARDVAAVSPPSRTGNVQYIARYGWLSSERVDAENTATVAIYPTLTRWWLMPDGAVRVDETRSAPLDVHGRMTEDIQGAPDRSTSDTSPAGTIDPDVASRLSEDPAALRSTLLDTQAGLPCDQDARWQAECLVRAIQMVYDQYVVPPELASAMWRVLADEQALRTLGTTVDRLGRPAGTVALPSEPGETPEQVAVLLLSKRTGEYLGSETVTLRDPTLKIDRPTVTGFSELSAARWVRDSGGTA